MKLHFQKKKRFWLYCAITAFFLIAGLPATSSAISYSIYRVMSEGHGIVNGTITTDDTIGPLGAGNILSWDLHLEVDSGPGLGLTTADLSSASHMFIYGGGLSATSTELIFDFASTGYARFEAPPGGGNWWCLDGTWGFFGACGLGKSLETVRTNPLGLIPKTSYASDIAGGHDGKIVIGTAVDDSDGDGIPDDEDACPFSELSETVVIDGWDSGVDNVLLEDGCTISDLISQAADDADDHGEFVSAVAHITNYLKKEGIISGKEKGRIQKGAAKAAIP